ncbi:MAG: ParB N-terminal domain-containing protein [Novosphingobium sp.]|nr:ParB N-terminal domain-containing protein [Novosphingobium sp.]
MTVTTHTPAGGEVLLLPVSEIDPDGIERIGFFHDKEVATLADLISSDVQLEPIVIAAPAPRSKDRRWRLVIGRHRLAACAMLGIEVLARVVTGTNDELLRMQTAEQLDRRDMTVLERAAFVGRRAEIIRERLMKEAGADNDQSLGGRPKKLWTDLSIVSEDGLSDADKALLAKLPKQAGLAPQPLTGVPKEEVEADVAAVAERYGWRAEVAGEFNLHFKKMDRLLTIYRGLIKPLRAECEAIAQCRIANNADGLLQLAGKAEAVRRVALGWLAQNPDAKTAEEALVALGLSSSKGAREADRLEGESKFLTRAESNLARLTPGTWTSWAPKLAETIKPSALLAVRDAIDARIAALAAKGGK